MVVRLTSYQYRFLTAWGARHKQPSARDAARLLLAMLLECQGRPPELADLGRPQYQPSGWNGHRVYSCSVILSPLGRSPKTRALWLWGLGRGQQTIAGAFRALVDLLSDTWDDDRDDDANLAAFAAEVGLRFIDAA